MSPVKKRPVIARPVITKKDYLIVVWNYFQLHVDQRLRTFHFFIIFTSLLFTGYIVVLDKPKIPQFGTVIGILIMIFSFIFWKIDKRNRSLVGNALSALIEYESSFTAVRGKPKNPFKIITNDFEDKQKKRKKCPILYFFRLSRYSHCFNLIYFVIGFVGFLAFLYSLLKVHHN